MGKKRIIKQDEKELLKERERVEEKVKKETKTTSQKIKRGKVFIFSSYNNTIITLSDLNGNVLSWVSAGSIGFKGAKKSTPFAASKVAEAIVQAAQKFDIQEIEIFVKGVGSGRESAIRSLAARGFKILLIKDTTPIPHNGCRPPKVRRL